MNAVSGSHTPRSLEALALPGWMKREGALGFLQNDCISADPLTTAQAEELWLKYKRRVEELTACDARPTEILPMSEADVKAARKFRARHTNEHSIIDIVRLNPMDLIVHQHWISPSLAEPYAASAVPAKWNQTTLLDPPASTSPKPRQEGNTFVFDLPHAEFLLTARPGAETLLQLTEPKAFVTVAFHAGRALLLTGYHRTFALACHLIAMADAPRGALFAVSNTLNLMGSEGDEVKAAMTSARPPRFADFFNPELCVSRQMKRRRFQMRVSYEIFGSDVTEDDTAMAPGPEEGARQNTAAVAALGVHATLESAARLRREGRIEEAIQSYAAILQLQPNNKDVHLNLSSALLEAGWNPEAKAHAERAVWLDPGSADAQCNLAAVLRAEGATDLAKRHCLQALAIDPEHHGGLISLGEMHSIAGEFDDARSIFRKVLARQADCAEAWLSLAMIKTFSASDPELAELERFTSRRGLAGKDAVFAHFALAKALEDCAEYDRAFEHLRTGNECQRKLKGSDERNNIELFGGIGRSFTGETIERLAGKGNPTRVPVFVVGMPRSGTTLIEQILASHCEVHGAGELDSLRLLLRGNVDVADPSAVAGLDPMRIQNLADGYLQSLPSCPDKERIVNKTPSNFLLLGVIHVMFPNARIIHAVRDPLDTCVSCYAQLFNTGQLFSYDLGELGRYYHRYFDLMTHWRSVLPAGCILDVHYEELVSDFDAQVARVLDFCGLEWDENCRSFYRTSRPVNTASLSQVRQPLYGSSVGRWRRFEKHLGALLQELKMHSVGMVA